MPPHPPFLIERLSVATDGHPIKLNTFYLNTIIQKQNQ
jgi:hypothetical protein